MRDEFVVYAVLAAVLILLVWGRIRYDIVALLGLITLVLFGVVEAPSAFLGFGHPAVVTVAAVLIISRGLQNAGVVDLLVRALRRAGNKPTAQIGALGAASAFCSAFINNVGALALFMPVAMRMARTAGRTPAYILMPLAFTSLLGGLTTLIGSPPNLIISAERAKALGEPYRMFDFTPVGGAVAVACIAFIALIGWRFIPSRTPTNGDTVGFSIDEYTAELTVPAESKFVGSSMRDLGSAVDADFVVLSIIRGERELNAPGGFETVHAGDRLLVAGDHEAIKTLRESAQLALAGERKPDEDQKGAPAKDPRKGLILVEAIVGPRSILSGRTPAQLNLRWRYGVNLLAVARQGFRVRGRFRDLKLRTGDVMMLHVPSDNASEVLSSLGCLPLAERAIDLGRPKRLIVGLGVFIIAVALAATGVLPTHIALVSAAVVIALTGVVSLREAYDAIDWPIIVLLGAMMPLGDALESTGGAQRIADLLLHFGGGYPPIITLVLFMVVALFLSDIVNNAAVAVLLAPIAVLLARGFDVSVDAFLMGTLLGASAGFLTPIGHQANTIVFAPGGYKFGDYARLGIPMSVVYVVVGTIAITIFWPLKQGG